MLSVLIAAFVLFSSMANADEIVTVNLKDGAESIALFQSLKSPKTGDVDENGQSILIRRFATSDTGLVIQCIQNPMSWASSCSSSFRMGSTLNVDTKISIAPTGALVAELSEKDSQTLFRYLDMPKRYSTQEKVKVEFNDKIYYAPRLSIDCPTDFTSPMILNGPCKVVAFY